MFAEDITQTSTHQNIASIAEIFIVYPLALRYATAHHSFELKFQRMRPGQKPGVF